MILDRSRQRFAVAVLVLPARRSHVADVPLAVGALARAPGRLVARAVVVGEVVEDDGALARVVVELRAEPAEEAGHRIELVVAGVAGGVRAVRAGDVLLRVLEADRGQVVAEEALQHVGRALAVEIGRGVLQRDGLLVAERQPFVGDGEGAEVDGFELEHRLGLVDLGFEAQDLLERFAELIRSGLDGGRQALDVGLRLVPDALLLGRLGDAVERP